MDKEILIKLIEKGFSTRKIGKELNKSQGSIRHWLKKYDLKTELMPRNKGFGKSHCCKVCGDDNPVSFYKKHKSYCKKCDLKRVNEISRKNRSRALEYKGLKCIKCGYDKCNAAMEFHHRDSGEKDSNFNSSKLWKWERLKKELDKCDLVCANCHREIHWKNSDQAVP